MTQALDYALARTRAVTATAHTEALEMKARGRIDGAIAPSAALGTLAGYTQQGANRERYNLFRGWLYSAIHAIASEAAAQPVMVGKLAGTAARPDEDERKRRNRTKAYVQKMPPRIRRKAAKHDFEIQDDHPLTVLLEQPNPCQNRFEFVYSFVANLYLTGWAFIIGDGNTYYSVPTTWVTPRHDKGLFAEFELRNPSDPAAEPTILPRKFVGMARLPDPANPFGAKAPAGTQIRSVRIDDHIQESQERFFEQGIFPSAIVTIGKDPHPDVPGGGTRPRLTAAQRRQVHAAIAKTMSGVANYGNPAIVDGLIESIERLSATSNEMGWDKSEDKNRARILSAVGVHPFILGEAVAVGGYAQVYSIEKRFFKRVNVPLDMLSQLMTNFAAPKHDTERLLVWWEECIAKDTAIEEQQWAGARTRGDVTDDEYRAERLGLPPKDNEAIIAPALAASVLTTMQSVGKGEVTPEQARALFMGMGIPDDVAEELAGEGPSEALMASTEALNGAVGAMQKPVAEEAEEVVAEAAKRVLRMPSYFKTPALATKVSKPREYSCVLALLPADAADAVWAMAAAIPDEDLADDGREDEPHVTVKFGLHTEDVNEVKAVLRGQGPVTCRFGKVSLFVKEGEYDVVKIAVSGEALHALNAKISDELECTDTHPTYQPHATIAYVKPGLGQKYLGMANRLEGKEATFHTVLFSDKRSKKTTIPLTGPSGPSGKAYDEKTQQAPCRVPAGHSGGGQFSSCGGDGAYPPANPAGKDTYDRYRTPDGGWTPERRALHDKIIAAAFEGKTPVDKPVAYMMGGGPAAGKSTALKAGGVDVPENSIHIDSDALKAKLPEYAAMVAAGDLAAAPYAHEESSYLAAQIQKKASAGGYNTVLDGTGDSDVGKVLGKTAAMRAAGQRVKAHYVTCGTEQAVQRAYARAAKTGRMPPETFIRATHAAVSRTVPEVLAAGGYDEFTLWDTSGSGTVKVAEAVGSDLRIHDQAAWDAFVAKGK